ncbi:MAG: OmpA family protein [Oceanococcaceae bacterium]
MVKTVACATLMAWCGVALAWTNVDHRPETYIGIIGSFVDPDDARLTDRDGVGLDLLIGREFTPWFALEGQVSAEIHDSLPAIGQDNYRASLGVDALFMLGNRSQYSAFVLLGLGGSYYDTNSNARNDESFYVNVGGGVISQPFTKSRVRVRLEGRYRREGYGPDVDDYRAGVGLEFPLGLQPRTTHADPVLLPVPVTRPAAPPPSPPVEDYPPRPVDRDQDGVLDQFDQCPNSQLGELVDRTGCRVEFQDANLSLDGVSFESGSDQLTAQSRNVLTSVAAILEDTETTVTIAGHTDSQGDEEYNLRLSLARATAVKRFLTQRGVAASRLKVAGFGESQPMADNRTAEGRARNRRVEFRVDSAFDPK